MRLPGLVVFCAVAMSVSVGLACATETEEVTDAEWAILEQAMQLAGAGKAAPDHNVVGPATVENKKDQGGNAKQKQGQTAGQGVGDLEDCIVAGTRSGRGKRRTRDDDALLTPLELCRARGRSSIYVTEICSQVTPHLCSGVQLDAPCLCNIYTNLFKYRNGARRSSILRCASTKGDNLKRPK